jgi:hypothetical protein
VELREEKEKSEKQAREKDLNAIFEHPSSGLSLEKKKWLVKDNRIYVERCATKGRFAPSKGQGLV